MNQLDEILGISGNRFLVALTWHEQAKKLNQKEQIVQFLADYIEATPEQRNRLQLLLSGGDDAKAN